MAEQNSDELECPMPSNDTKFMTDSDMDSSSVSPNIDLSETSFISDVSSPNKSRYGRSHKPKSPGDFLSHDKRVSAIMKISPFNQMQYYNFPKEKKKIKVPKKTTSQAPDENPSGISNMPFSDKSMDEDCNEIDKEHYKSWKIGDLVWAKIGRHPYWPAMIVSDPDSKPIKRHLRKGRYSSLEIHVIFYADNGRRSWISLPNILPFECRSQFLKLQHTLSVRLKTKEFRKSGCHIKPSILDWWKSAVKEAEGQKERTREERMEFFNQMLTGLDKSQESPTEPKLRGRTKLNEAPTTSSQVIIATMPSKKRKLIDDAILNNSPAKQPKYDKKVEEIKRDSKKEEKIISPTTPLRTIADRKKRQATLLELARACRVITPASKKTKENPKEHVPEIIKSQKSKTLKDTYKAVSKVRKHKTKKLKLDNDFNFYCTKHFSRTRDDYPDLADKEIYKLLKKRWKDMDDAQKSRYRARLTTAQNIVRPETDDSESDIEESGTSENGDQDCEANEAAPEPIVAATSKGGVGKRAISLFTGAKPEKACLICEKPGYTVRCRGPCNGSYHLDCIIKKKNNPNYKVEEKIDTTKKYKGKKGKQDKSFLRNIEEPSTSRDNNLSIALRNEENNDTSSETEVSIDIEKVSDVVQNTEVSSSDTCEETDNKISKKSKSRKGSKDSDSSDDGDYFRCPDCLEGKTQPCFVCNNYSDPKNNSTKMHRCHTARCGKVYHLNCLKAWPQTTWSSGRRTYGKNGGEGVMTCPQHCCHTCVSDNPAVVKARYTNDKIVRCLRCPTSYHYGNHCIPAGTEIVTQTQIICPLHYKPTHKKGISHVNAAWCFICASGGSLICCDLCPTAFHADCLNILPPDGGYICEDCQTGRFPLYGEIVWVKLGSYRWWPAEILFPALVPENIQNLPHVRGEFAVRFFGSHDYYWVNRGRVFLLHENDNGSKTTKKSSVDTVFARAVQEALVAHERLKTDNALRVAEVRTGMKPPSYVKIKSNKAVGNVRTVELNISNMTPCECKPDFKNPCAPESDCLNRLLMVECNPLVCPAGDRCNNQLFEKRIYPLLKPFQTETRGWGLKTMVNIKKGDFVIEYVGEMIDEIEYKKRLSKLHATNDENYYFLTIDKDRLLDAGPKGNVSRFMNHSCQPNCETQKWTVNGDTRVGLFALCDISAGTELVFNYNLEPFGNDKKPCMCGAPNCSGFIGVKANKQTNEDDKKIKSPKKKVKHPVKISEEECFICHEIGELILCDNKTCPKAYHIECLKKSKKPQGFWVCPWHHCTVCNKGRVRRCSVCINSYCQEHSEGNIRLHEEEGLLCNKHYKEGVSGGTISIVTNSKEFLEYQDVIVKVVDIGPCIVKSKPVDDQLSHEVEENIMEVISSTSDSVIEHQNNLNEEINESESKESVVNVNESEPTFVQFEDDKIDNHKNCSVEFNLISVVNGSCDGPDKADNLNKVSNKNDTAINVSAGTKCEDLNINTTRYVDAISTSITNSESDESSHYINLESSIDCSSSQNVDTNNTKNVSSNEQLKTTNSDLNSCPSFKTASCNITISDANDDNAKTDIVVPDKPLCIINDDTTVSENLVKCQKIVDPILDINYGISKMDIAFDIPEQISVFGNGSNTIIDYEVEPMEVDEDPIDDNEKSCDHLNDLAINSTVSELQPKEDGEKSNVPLSDLTTNTGGQLQPREDGEKSSVPLSDLTKSTGGELQSREDDEKSRVHLSGLMKSTGDELQSEEDNEEKIFDLSSLSNSTGNESQFKEDGGKLSLYSSEYSISIGDDSEPKEDSEKSRLYLCDLVNNSEGELQSTDDSKKSILDLSGLSNSTGNESQFKEDSGKLSLYSSEYSISIGDDSEPKEDSEKSRLYLCDLVNNSEGELQSTSTDDSKKSILDLSGLSISTGNGNGNENENTTLCLNVSEPSCLNESVNNSFNENASIGSADSNVQHHDTFTNSSNSVMSSDSTDDQISKEVNSLSQKQITSVVDQKKTDEDPKNSILVETDSINHSE